MRAMVNVDGQEYEGNFLLVIVSNSRLYASAILLNPGGKIDDGLFEVWLFQGKRGDSLMDAAARAGRLLRYAAQAMLGRHYQEPGMLMVRGRQVTIHTEPTMPFQADGEPAGWTPFTCQIRAGALRLLVPNTASADLFEQRGEILDIIGNRQD
jgi:diacylglycerol kinase family enzyme